MKTLSLFTFCTFLISSAAFAGNLNSEEWESKTYKLGEFTELYLEGGYRVYLIQGDENSLTVKASDNDVFDYLDIKNNSDLLSLKIEREHFNFDRVNLYITFKKLEKIEIEGGVKLSTKGYLDLDDFFIYVMGGAKIELDLKADDVTVIGEGGVLFELNGVAKNLDIKVSGAGHVNAEELRTENVDFRIEGVGTGSVYATEKLYAQIEGVGKVKYRGNPKVVKSIEGVGSVTKK